MTKRKLHGKTIKIFGPPGTGKTHQLLRRIKWFIKNGTHPSEIAYFSFTNKAVDETIMRLKAELPKYTEDDFPYFSTIHSFARKQFGNIPVLDPAEDMIQFHSDYGTIKINAQKGFEDQKVFNNWSLRIYDRARNTKQDPIFLYKQQDRKEIRLSQFKSIITAYEHFKTFESEPGVRQKDRLDFTDMIEKFIEEGTCPKLKVLMIDESQDLTPLQWDLVLKLSHYAERIYLAGDDDQAIYEWNGADADFFIRFPGKIKILKQSRRIPGKVHYFSQLLMVPAEGFRQKKEFNPRSAEGEILTYNNVKHVDFSKKESFMVLSRIRTVKEEVEQDLYDMGLYFQDVQGRKSFPIEQWQAVKAWDHLMNGGSITREEACIVYHYLQNIDHGYRSSDSQKWNFANPTQPFNYDELQIRAGLREPKGHWIDAFKIRFKDKEKQYLIRLIESGVNLDESANIIVDTIHAVKGGEADNVVILSKANWPSHYERKNLDEKIRELRVWYTGITRTKKALHLINTDHKYHFPLGKFYNYYKTNYEQQIRL
jgi:superfamily I DNA/RNA helicase